jgi:alpha-1,3-rhamnosyl/mannosyltransferase
VKILIPALQVGPGQTGIGVFTRELVRALSDLPLEEDFLIAAPFPEEFGFLGGNARFRVEPVRLLRYNSLGRMLAMHTTIARLAERSGADLVLGTNYISPVWGRFERAVFVQDLTFVHYPWTMAASKRWYYRTMVRRSIRGALRVFVTTQAMAREVSSYEPRAAQSLRIVPGGVSTTYLANGDEEERSTWRLAREPRRDLLFVGTLEPRKNLERLLAAHSNLCRFDPGFPSLRVVGGRGWEDAGIRQTILSHSDPRRLHLLGYCSDADLRREYRSALALVFPSLYEGFGLPALEAMASGCPVLTSRDIATAEVAGDAALLVDPLETGDLERGLRRLASDPKLRARLSAAGRARAREFSWENSARLTLEALREPGFLERAGTR